MVVFVRSKHANKLEMDIIIIITVFDMEENEGFMYCIDLFSSVV